MDTEHEYAREAGLGRLRAASRWYDVLAVEVLRAWRARVTARQTSRDSLRIYREVVRSRPELAGAERYAEVVARQTGLNEPSVRAVLAHAEDSFASWPVERALRFRDVVQYLVARQCLDADATAMRSRSSLAMIVAEEIPHEL